MLTFNDRLATVFNDLIELDIEKLSENLLAGQLNDISEYKRLTGRIGGLREAREALSEAISICEGRKDDERSGMGRSSQ